MGFGRYVTARVLWAAVVSLIIVTITFLLLSAAPNPAVQRAATQAALQGGDPAEAAERVRELRGLDQPLHVRYFDFIRSVYTLDWGWSVSRSQPVMEAVTQALYYTAQYSIPWTILTITLGPLVGVYSAANMYSWKDHAATGFAFFGYAIPNFFFGIILLLIFGVWLEVIPVIYNTSAPVFSVENAIQLSVPVFVLVTGSIGAVMRVSRNESAEFQNADFMKTAKAKGVSPLRAYAYHVMRPTLVPLSTTLVGQLLALFLGSSLLVEVVFGIPGLGRLTYEALLAQDTNLVLGTTLFFTFVAVIGNLLEDIVFTVLDPRISYDDR
ncbi:ABC transporter permease [Halorubrum ezzemoulense]|uniref:ABC transporter permease n=2 Tax=Halorubrum ezzemoulense TaxID=337243 RepID=A0A256JNU4_HALEZ|nr:MULTISPECIES: ABC transporter permease [Halorubrum]MDB2223667.1 ABC transporter permease [Halorubrum ezzemoulense]MDB2236548.1 ABC transporter permease [Halorubrum ezzemoulense]MDB2241095.1 ABC transporter permease [Halorubrum ezzemoulense]MDB2244794.1 ABC transporter permease [Halorubrum ezzemoulense]MDB2248164.1 ABC transporter permease [Halorubrum ezzemoulense]